MSDVPEWWFWELNLSKHVLHRMIDRGFSETDLRTMLEDATGLAPNHEPSRWVVTTTHNHVPWEVIVEPVGQYRILMVVTAYEVD